MKVRAVRMGYFEHRRRPEDSVFIIPDKPVGKDGKPVMFGDWMEEVKNESVPVKDTKFGSTANPTPSETSQEEGGGADVI